MSYISKNNIYLQAFGDRMREEFLIAEADDVLSNILRLAEEAISALEEDGRDDDEHDDEEDDDDMGECLLHRPQPDYGSMTSDMDWTAIPALYSQLWCEGDDDDREMIRRELRASKTETEAYWSDVHRRWNALY